jgi:hypothetical protein
VLVLKVVVVQVQAARACRRERPRQKPKRKDSDLGLDPDPDFVFDSGSGRAAIAHRKRTSHTQPATSPVVIGCTSKLRFRFSRQEQELYQGYLRSKYTFPWGIKAWGMQFHLKILRFSFNGLPMNGFFFTMFMFMFVFVFCFCFMWSFWFLVVFVRKVHANFSLVSNQHLSSE